ncbi:MAG: hypothetical protein HY044_04870 [Candidatus Woesebacteria bacterium]|nr:MAG: hypothetical protein HY044_04870 [Candidatus Woesebacteria bacterium]
MIVKISAPEIKDCSSPCQKLDAIRIANNITDLTMFVRFLAIQGIRTSEQELTMIQTGNYLPAFEQKAQTLVLSISEVMQ